MAAQLEYQLRWQRDGYSVEAAAKKGRALPDDHWSLDLPDHVPGEHTFHEAFRDLMTCRPPEGPIPWTAAVAYADRKGLSGTAAELLWFVVRRMDAVERRWTYEAMKQEAGIG